MITDALKKRGARGWRPMTISMARLMVVQSVADDLCALYVLPLATYAPPKKLLG